MRSSGIASAGVTPVSASAANLSAPTMSIGSTILSPDSSSSRRQVSTWSASKQRAADAVALGGEEREAHAAADQQPVDLGQQRLDDRELVAHLGPAQHDHVGPLGVGGQPGEDLELAGHQPPGVVRQPLRHVEHRRVLAVHGAERVVDVDVGEGGQPVGQLAARRVVLRRLGGLEPDVLQQQDVAVGQCGRLGGRVVTGDVRRERHGRTEELRQPRRHRREGELRVGRSLGPAEVRGDDDAGAGVAQGLQRRQAGADPAVVGDGSGALVQGDVQVGAHEDAPTGDALGEEVVQGTHLRWTYRPGWSGRRGGWSSPTRCRTSRAP